VLVANHASYLDAVVVVASLPTGLSYVAKRDLAGAFLSRLLFQRLGIESIERFDTQRSVEDAARVLDAIKHGRAMVFFPEGTFGREPGLRPFRMGAFVVAAKTGAPVVPMAIRGTRSILRAGQWLPRRGAIRVNIGTPIRAEAADWTAAITLRDAAREAILKHCGEPALENPADRGPRSPET
jgi:1-acyl-sn-glycerol-3-phosphate acyltransferase